MTKKGQIEIPQILERYELKYHIPFDLVEPISDFVKPYCDLDEYSQREKTGFYIINNLYFDSPFYTFLKNRLEGAEKRFNMRLRIYGLDPVPPYFFEIKHKTGDVIRKYRTKCRDENVEDMLYCTNSAEKYGLTGSDAENMNLFQRLAVTYNVEPKVFTQYSRKAWISNTDDYARVTFDIDLKCMEADSVILKPDMSKMVQYDYETIFQPGCNTILELKCYTSNVPSWIIDLIYKFNLKRSSFSKYSNGALKILGDYRSYLKSTDSSDR
ncbi:MAG TPA: polyphosphate polymerase domain-containing protein [bacterium]|nr:polyphosphate polymerase domain-containing protein [bacterium]